MTTQTPTPSAQQDTVLTDEQIKDICDQIDFGTMVTADDYLYVIARAIEAAVKEYLPAAPSASNEAVAYLDIGEGGYTDVGSDLTDKQLSQLPKGRHLLGIVGTFGVDGYTAAFPDSEQVSGDETDEFVALLRKYKNLCIEIGRGDSHHLGRIDKAIERASQASEDVSDERQRGYAENAAFRVWWDENQACPEHSLTTENAAHAAWQERGRRAALASAPVADKGCPHIDEPRSCWRVRCQLGKKCVEPVTDTSVASAPASEDGLTAKQAWWAGYRAGKGLPPDTPRQDAVKVDISSARLVTHWPNGTPRDERDTASDPEGKLIHDPTEPLLAASAPVAGEAFKDECAATGQTCSYGPHGPHGQRQCKYCGAEPDAAPQASADDYEAVLADHRRLVRELDVLLNGESDAAKQASLCDIVAQVQREGIKAANLDSAKGADIELPPLPYCIVNGEGPREIHAMTAAAFTVYLQRYAYAAVLADRQKRGGDVGERAAFERWMGSEGFGFERNGDSYSFSYARRAWETWQARAALAAPKPVNEQGGGNG